MTSASTFPFCTTEHVIDGQYIREYPRATLSQDSPVKLVVKKYTPKNNSSPQPGDVTIVGAHGCGFPKELYEPMWEDLLEQSSDHGFRIGSIWIADVAALGASGIVNEPLLGDDPSWLDHSRDMMCMINKFRDEMPRPIIGVGHSMGAGQLALLSLMHPRLFTSLVLIEPVIVPDTFSGLGPKLSLLSLKRQDTWPSRSAAIESAQKSHRRWDPRVFERWIQYGYRELPTSTYPQIRSDTGLDTNLETVPVTLATSKYLEVMEYVRPNFEGHKPPGKEEHIFGHAHDLLTHPDVIGPVDKTSPFYKSEAVIAWKLLDHIRPSVLYVIGDRSPIQTDIIRAELVCRTGVGAGGSGGAKSSQVKESVIERSGHQDEHHYHPAAQEAEEKEITTLIEKINIQALTQRASDLRNGLACSVARDLQYDRSMRSSVMGGMNYHIEISFEDGISWLARIRRSNATSLPPELRNYILGSEVSTLKFLSKTKVPAPEVFDFNPYESNAVVQQESYINRPIDAFLIHRFLLEIVPTILSKNDLDDGMFYLKHADEKGDQILVDNDFNITGIIDWEWAQIDSKSAAFNSPIVLLPVADFYEGADYIGGDELYFAECLEEKGHSDLGEIVRNGRLLHRIQFCCGYDLDDWDGFIGLFFGLLKILGIEGDSQWETWRAGALEGYRDDDQLQQLLQQTGKSE
ncbi:hypothetical protein MYU51_013817 [Penicillium brevicompactum]